MAGFGETLKQARAHKSVTLREAEQATRINRHHLAALEEENFDALPPLIYQRGIVRNYASYLDIDPGKMISMFEEAHGITATGASRGVASPPIDMPSHWAPNFAIIGFAVVLSAIVFAWCYSIYVTPQSEDPEATVIALANTPSSQSVDIATDLPDAPVPPTAVPTETTAPTATTEETSQISGRQNAASPTENPYATGLAVEASQDVDLTVIVDGEVVYDDVLPAGQVTDQFVGSLFDISTSAGENTVFINSCGDKTPIRAVGPQQFQFPANEDSCKP